MLSHKHASWGLSAVFEVLRPEVSGDGCNAFLICVSDGTMIFS